MNVLIMLIMLVVRVWKVTLMVVEENKKVRVVCKSRHISIDVVVINVLLITKTCFSSLFTFTTSASFVHGHMTTSQNVSLGAFHFVDEKEDKKKECFICTIALPMHAFSKRQWHKKDLFHQGSVFLVSKSSCQTLEA
jgi:hypothetical protein